MQYSIQFQYKPEGETRPLEEQFYDNLFGIVFLDETFDQISKSVAD